MVSGWGCSYGTTLSMNVPHFALYAAAAQPMQRCGSTRLPTIARHAVASSGNTRWLRLGVVGFSASGKRCAAAITALRYLRRYFATYEAFKKGLFGLTQSSASAPTYPRLSLPLGAVNPTRPAALPVAGPRAKLQTPRPAF